MISSSSICYTCIPYPFLTDQILEKCSILFNNNYGIWSDDAPRHSNNILRAGVRVRLAVKRLRELLLFNERCFLVIAEKRSSETNQFELIGHVFCTWVHYHRLNGNAMWITQLVVSSSYRGQGVAGNLLSNAKNSVEDVVSIGLVSSHPHAVLALSNACNRIPIDLKFIANHAEDIMGACNVPYLSGAQLVGSIFNKESVADIDDHQRAVSLVQTNFFVDHREPLLVLAQLEDRWVLGPLFDGHEFLIVLPTTSVRRSKTPSSSMSVSDGSP